MVHQAVTLILWFLSYRECGAGTFVNFASLERDGKLPYNWCVFFQNKPLDRVATLFVLQAVLYYLWGINGFCLTILFQNFSVSGLSKVRSAQSILVYISLIQLWSSKSVIVCSAFTILNKGLNHQLGQQLITVPKKGLHWTSGGWRHDKKPHWSTWHRQHLCLSSPFSAWGQEPPPPFKHQAEVYSPGPSTPTSG